MEAVKIIQNSPVKGSSTIRRSLKCFWLLGSGLFRTHLNKRQETTRSGAEIKPIAAFERRSEQKFLYLYEMSLFCVKPRVNWKVLDVAQIKSHHMNPGTTEHANFLNSRQIFPSFSMRISRDRLTCEMMKQCSSQSSSGGMKMVHSSCSALEKQLYFCVSPQVFCRLNPALGEKKRERERECRHRLCLQT